MSVFSNHRFQNLFLPSPNVNINKHLLIRVSILTQPGNPSLKQICMTHIQEVAQILIFPPWNKSKFVILVIDCYSFRIILVFSLPYELQLFSNLQFSKCFTTVLIHKACKIVVKVMFPFFYSMFNNAISLIDFKNKVK